MTTPFKRTPEDGSVVARHIAGGERLREPIFVDIQHALAADRLIAANELIRKAGDPSDPAVLWARAALAARSNDHAQAEELLRSALRQEPGFNEARWALARVLIDNRRWEEALEIFSLMTQSDPQEIKAGLWAGWTHAQLGDIKLAISVTEHLLGRAPTDPRIWLNLGHWYKADGRSDDGLQAYRRATSNLATCADAWWGIANTKRVKFDESSVSAMQAAAKQYGSGNIPIPLHFALANALEDVGRYAEAFAHLNRGSQLYLGGQTGLASRFVNASAEARSIFTPEVVERLGGKGCATAAPIFIVGMPRSGTTLIEQILDSHSQVEALGELPYMDDIAASVRSKAPTFRAAINSLTSNELSDLGERYLTSTKRHRNSGKAHFVDKMPSNWLHAGIIHLIFPNARIIDARRHPLDCCLSNFRQYFPRGHEFTYSLDALGHVYRACLENSAHFQQLIPERWTVAVHERFIENPDGAIRSLLQSLGLELEEGCLRFFENRRPVTTPSAEQVRQPINAAGAGRWRNYEQWLEPLQRALGPALHSYPAAPSERGVQ